MTQGAYRMKSAAEVGTACVCEIVQLRAINTSPPGMEWAKALAGSLPVIVFPSIAARDCTSRASSAVDARGRCPTGHRLAELTRVVTWLLRVVPEAASEIGRTALILAVIGRAAEVGCAT